MERWDTFLANHPPFDALGPTQLEELVAGADERTYEPGVAVLVEDAPPAEGLWVILTGSMELVHEGEVMQVLTPGQCFGHPSLLTGLAPAFTVRAHERSRCLRFGADAGRRVLGTQAGAAYVAASMRTRLVSTGHTVHGLHEVGTTPVSAIMRPPEFCAADEPLRAAAGRLGEGGSAALLVELDDDGLGLVSDAEVRGAVAAGLGMDVPVRELARTPVASVPPAHLAVEAAVDMLAAGTEHLVVADRGQVRGVLSAADLLGLDARSPIALRHMILGAHDETELVRAVANLPKLFLLLTRAGVPPADLGRVLTLQHDAVVARLIDFSTRARGPAPVAWTWLALGSAARREFTLASDQDNALAYDTPLAFQSDETDAYFARLGADVNAGLVRCGIGVDNNDVVAGNRQWRMSKTEWLRTFGQVLLKPGESQLIRASVAFDFRQTAGGLSVAPELTEYIRAARGHAQFMRLMARTATGYPVALRRRGQLATGQQGDPTGRLDIKRGGIIPLVNLVRFHALAHGVTISPTLDRLDALARVGGLEPDLAGGLAEAFDVISRVRFEHHAALIDGGGALDNLIDPEALPPIERTELREALDLVRRAQRRLEASAPAKVTRL